MQIWQNIVWISLTSLIAAEDTSAWNGLVLAWVLMAFMLVALGITAWRVWRAFQGLGAAPGPAWLTWSIPILAVLGLGVSVYLTYVEATSASAVCGPVGDCNAVQTSSYARLFGLIPIGLIGTLGYVAILAAWVWQRLSANGLVDFVPISILGMAAFGTLFSVYLTYLEIFVIKAVCIWCLSSALIITLIMLAGLPPAAAWLSPVEEVEA